MDKEKYTKECKQYLLLNGYKINDTDDKIIEIAHKHHFITLLNIIRDMNPIDPPKIYKFNNINDLDNLIRIKECDDCESILFSDILIVSDKNKSAWSMPVYFYETLFGFHLIFKITSDLDILDATLHYRNIYPVTDKIK